MADDPNPAKEALPCLPGWPADDALVAGAVDYLSPDKGIFGWVIDLGNPTQELAVELICGGEIIAVGQTSLSRPDITAALSVEGDPGFGVSWDNVDYKRLTAIAEAEPDAVVEIRVPACGAYLTKYPGYQLLQELSAQTALGYVRARQDSLDETGASAAPEAVYDGFIDFYGFCAPTAGWFFCGWIAAGSDIVAEGAAAAASVIFETGTVTGAPVMAFFFRPDLGSLGTGLVIYVPGPGKALGNLNTLEIRLEGMKMRLPATSKALQFRDRDLAGRVRSTITDSVGPARDALMLLLSREGYIGQDTLGALSDPVFMEMDEAIFCPPDGLALLGWMMAKPGVIKAIRLHSGGASTELRIEDMVPVERQDVVDAIGTPYGLSQLRNGFVAYTTGFGAREQSYLAVETSNGEIAYKNIPVPKLLGLAAMKRVLSIFDARYVEVPPTYDRVIGPCIEALNRDRLEARPRVDVLEFGAVNPAPRHSVIVPLYGRIDYFEYQMALFSLHPPTRDFEMIYVLDDPSLRRPLELLAESVWERFGLPFRLLLLEFNMGFAPANNVALGYAHGEYLCYLNSDVFPGSPDWMEALVRRLEENPDLGCVGPLLLYEDDTIQHCGMEYSPLKMFGEWMFPLHIRKGWRRTEDDHGLQRCVAITGAAMVMRRSLAERLQGFDEIFAVGDFEDSDLCFKIDALGLASAVDLDVWLYHLERKSQIGPEQRWRLNLTLYNAWQHERRWKTRLEKI